jgi:hypothetical protein
MLARTCVCLGFLHGNKLGGGGGVNFKQIMRDWRQAEWYDIIYFSND